jgi:hypothetical protein
MAILKPTAVKYAGTWSITGGGSAVEMLTDSDDATGLTLNPAEVDNCLVMLLQSGGYPAAGDITLSVKGKRTGVLTISYGITVGDPGFDDLIYDTKEEAVISDSLETLTKVMTPSKQSVLKDMSNVWAVIRIVSAADKAQLFIAEMSLTVGDNPVETWNDVKITKPTEDALVWCSMGDGRSRQGKLINGEWYDEKGNPLELAASMFTEDADGDSEAARWVVGWGDITGGER